MTHNAENNGYNKHLSALMLLGAATIWGFAFVAQSIGMDYVGPFTFNAVRCLIGAIVLLPCITLLDALASRRADGEAPGAKKKVVADAGWKDPQLLKGGLVCGLLLCVASNLQQAGIAHTSVGKAGFITALYIVIVPLLGIFMRKKIGWRIWLSVVLAVAGLYLLCMTGELSLGTGDALMLGCALFFSFQIMAVDHYVAKANGVKLACVEFMVCGAVTAVLMFLFERPAWDSIMAAKLPILYAGVLSCGAAYTFQVLGQKGLNPAVASLIMSLESVISALGGWLILGQVLTARELTGCAVMFAAILLAQL